MFSVTFLLHSPPGRATLLMSSPEIGTSIVLGSTEDSSKVTSRDRINLKVSMFQTFYPLLWVEYPIISPLAERESSFFTLDFGIANPNLQSKTRRWDKFSDSLSICFVEFYSEKAIER